jgi:hypothetical protein
MPTLLAEYLRILADFAPLLSNCLWTHVHVLVVGAMLTPGQHTVTAILRIGFDRCDESTQLEQAHFGALQSWYGGIRKRPVQQHHSHHAALAHNL